MESLFPFAQIVTATILMILILLQQRGTALGSLFGSSDGGSYATRRGIQKHLLVATIGVGIVFIALSLAHFVL
ncbi:MAG: preprotein translocase subunit SecG [bacterium]|nr:preprotein translocase subunit SecG [bacterium]